MKVVMEHLKNRFRGALVGALIGDCLGAPYEGQQEVRTRDLVRNFKALDSALARDEVEEYRYTDDTAMLRSVASSLIENRKLVVKDMAHRFVDEYFTHPYRGYGGNVVTVFKLLREENCATPDGPASKQFDGAGSFGNGGAMRISPAALFTFNSTDEELVRHVQHITRITHTNIDAINGAILQCLAVRQALRRHQPSSIASSSLPASSPKKASASHCGEHLQDPVSGTLDHCLENAKIDPHHESLEFAQKFVDDLLVVMKKVEASQDDEEQGQGEGSQKKITNQLPDSNNDAVSDTGQYVGVRTMKKRKCSLFYSCLRRLKSDRDEKKEIEDDNKDDNDDRKIGPYCKKLKLVKEFLKDEKLDEITIEEVVEDLGNNISALGSVPAAVYSFLRGLKPIDKIPDQYNAFERTILYAISLGGDTDTIATMAGAIAGAYHGQENIIRKSWSSACEALDDAEKMADDLHHLVSSPRNKNEELSENAMETSGDESSQAKSFALHCEKQDKPTAAEIAHNCSAEAEREPEVEKEKREEHLGGNKSFEEDSRMEKLACEALHPEEIEKDGDRSKL